MPASALRVGDLLPDFEATRLDGGVFRYADLWQHANLVLWVLNGDPPAAAREYLSDLDTRLHELKPADTALVATAGEVANLHAWRVIICDRWGEVVHVESLEAEVSSWPPVAEILAWVEYIRARCEECPP